ncbi:hypothetical protein Ancab_019820, partial [Ancistrocladus abbreviatus]
MHRKKSAAGGRPKYDLSALPAGDTGGHSPETAAGERQKSYLSKLAGAIGDHRPETAAGEHQKSYLSELAKEIREDRVQGRGMGVQSRELYEAVLNNDLEKIEVFFSTPPNPMEGPQRQPLLQPLNVAGDTAFHIAAHQGYDLLRELLDLSQLSPLSSYEGHEITMQNVFGNTPLHEAAAAGCLDAVNLLCRTCPYLTKTKNQQGETAVFRAAAFGKTDVVEFLVSREIRQEELEYHCIRDCDSISILHVAILGHHI